MMNGPVTRAVLLTHLAAYNTQSRGSKEFAAIPRYLVTIMDGLAVGKTTHIKCADGAAQLTRRKDKSVATV